MNFARSLLGRVIIGVVLWTLGLFSLAGALVTYLVAVRSRHVVVVDWTHAHFTFALLFALVLLTGGYLYVRRGVSPIVQLRTRLSAVHEGQARRVDGDGLVLAVDKINFSLGLLL